MQLLEQLTIPKGSGKAFVVRAGHYLRVVTPEGPQAADLNVFNRANPRETFSASRTRVDHGLHLTTGDPLLSSPPGECVLMTITGDTVAQQPSVRGARSHDLIYGRCSRLAQMRRHGLDVPRGCQEILAEAIADFGLS